MQEEKNIKKYFFWAIIGVIALTSYFIVKSFIVPVISAFVLAYLVLPLYKHLSKAINKKVSALIVLILIITALIAPFYFAIKTLSRQMSPLVEEEIHMSPLIDEKSMEKISPIIASYISNLNLPFNLINFLPSLIEKATNYLLSVLYSLVSYIPNLAVIIILTFFISYFLLIDWDKLKEHFKTILPFKNKESMLKKLSETSHNIVYGTFLVAVIEFVIALIGFKIADIKFYILLAFILAILAFIPLLGPAVVWVPLLILKLIQQNYYSAIIILITGLILSILIDALLKTLIIGKKAKIHPIILLIGVLGGVKLFGIFGFIIGPLILSFLIDFIEHSMKEN